jgi:glycosyltransferase involved in cell wall biosynthesis
MTKPKVLAVAYACNPCRGSEEGVGWGWVEAIARHHEVWVLTAGYHRADIERTVNAEPERFQNVHFEYVPHKPWHYTPAGKWLKIEGSICKPLMHAAYKSWLRGANRLGRRLHREHGFDVVHQVTYVGFRFPGQLWKLGVPFVWGPVGGLVNVPWRLLPLLGLYGMAEFAGRNIVNTAHKILLPGPKKAFRRAAAVIAASSGIRDEIKRWYGRDSEVICEIGPPQERAAAYSTRKEGEPFNLAWSGQHLPGKALPLLLGALSQIDKEINWQIDILGEGPCTANWRGKAGRLGIGQRCRWHGWLPRNDALETVRNAHVFVITSMKDLTSTVLMEALALGLPVICPDHCGFADVVTDHCGIKVAVRGRRQLETDLAQAIIRLAGDEDLRQRLARGALARVKDYSWERKALQLDQIYRKALASSKY